MSRRHAAITQADVARVLRAAAQVGPEWSVEIVGPIIRLTRTPTTVTITAALEEGAPPAPPPPDDADDDNWSL